MIPAPDLSTFARDEMLARMRSSADKSRETIFFLTRPHPLSAVREVARILTKRAPAPSASRADMAYAIAVSLRPSRTRALRAGPRKRNTSPAACREALFGPLLSTTD